MLRNQEKVGDPNENTKQLRKQRNIKAVSAWCDRYVSLTVATAKKLITIGAPEVRAHIEETTDEWTITNTDPGGTEAGDQPGKVLCASGLIDRPGDETGYGRQPY